MSDRHQQELIQAMSDGEKVGEFLADPAVLRAIERVEMAYLGEFRKAETDDTRRAVWAKARAIEDVKAALRGSQDRGIAAKAEQTRSARR